MHRYLEGSGRMFEAVDTLAGYWEQRAQKFARHEDGLAAVCSFGMPRFYNQAIELCQKRALRPWLKPIVDADVLEIGCGVGRWTETLASKGNRLGAIDLSPTMIEEAQRRLLQKGLDADLRVADATSFDFEKTFDAAISVTVLQHIMDDQEFDVAFNNISQHLKVGARFVMLEAAPTNNNGRCNSPIFRARSLHCYIDALEKSGFRIDAICGVDPVPLKTWVLPHLGTLPRPLSFAAIAAVTTLSLPLDLLLARFLPDQSWHKVIVATRKG